MLVTLIGVVGPAGSAATSNGHAGSPCVHRLCLEGGRSEERRRATTPPGVQRGPPTETRRTGEPVDPSRPVNGQYPRPWPWFCFQTLCRALEFAMGCAMANITKQPVNSRHQLLQQQHAYSLRFKPRDSLYI